MWLLLLLAACTVAVLSCVHLAGIVAAVGRPAEEDPLPPEEPPGVGRCEIACLAGGSRRAAGLALV